VAHRKTVRVLFDALVIVYWEALRFWIRDYRVRTDPTLYARFEYLYDEIKSRERRAATKTDYVVTYGSLMDAQSLAAGLRREVTEDELIPVTLKGWTRRWSIGETVRVGPDSSPIVAAFLDAGREEGAHLVAAIVRVNPNELRRLGTREKNYQMVDVTADALLVGERPVESQAVVWCFVGAEAHRVTPESEGVVILESYLARVSAAAERLAPDAAANVRSSAAGSGFETLAGEYRFVDPDQAALV